MAKCPDDVRQNGEIPRDAEEVKKLTRWQVNKTLLPLKMFYFFFYGASGSVIPFITVYLKHLQLSASETGLITGAAVFFAMSVRPLIGMVADNWSAWKSALIVCCLGFGAAFFCLWFVPARTSSSINSTHSLDSVTSRPGHAGQRLRVWICWSSDGSPICSFPTVNNLSACQKLPDVRETHQSVGSDDVRLSLSDQLLTPGSHAPEADLKSEHVEFGGNRERTVKLPAKQEIQPDSGVHMPCFYLLAEPLTREQKTGSVHLNVANIQADGISSTDKISHIASDAVPALKTVPPDVNLPGCLSECVEYDVINESLTSSTNNSVDDVIYNITTATKPRRRGRYQGNITPDFVLFLSFLLIAVARSFYASSTSLADAVTYTVLGPSSYKWGQQRLWGTIGTAVAVITITVSDDQLKGEKFAALFVVCFGLSVMAALVGGLKLRADKFPKSNSFWSDVTRIISGGATRLFLAKLVFYGMMCGTATNFFMWYMVDLGSNQTNLGLVVLVHCLSSVACLRCSPRVLKRIGRANTINIVLVIYSIRYLAFSFLTSPWLALPVELLHGVTYSMFWAAASSTASILAPMGTQATYQSIAGAVYWDLGRGLGTLVTGQILDVFGAPWTFRAYSITCALVIPFIFMLDRRWPIGSQQKNIDIVKECDADGAEVDSGSMSIKLLNTDTVDLTTEVVIKSSVIKEDIPQILKTSTSSSSLNKPKSLGNGTGELCALLVKEEEGCSRYDPISSKTLSYLDNTVDTSNEDFRTVKEFLTSHGNVGVTGDELVEYPDGCDRQIRHPTIASENCSGVDFSSRVSELNSLETIDKSNVVEFSAWRGVDTESSESLATSMSLSTLDHDDVDLSDRGSFEDRLLRVTRPKSDSLIPNLSCRNLESDASGDDVDEHFMTKVSSGSPDKHHQVGTQTCAEPRGLE